MLICGCLSTVFPLGFYHFPMVSSQNKGNKTSWQFLHIQLRETHLESHLIFHLHNYCKPCTSPACLNRQRPRLSNCHPQFGYKGKTVLPSNTVVKRCVYLFFALRTILFLAATATAVSLAIIIKWRKRRTHSAQRRRHGGRVGSNKDSWRHLRSLETHFQVLGR